ncbi:MAG: Gfo/Idh/MocA family oxidoreductase [Clostridiales bacterium]|jgi:predicted dehydrogenase|nr:Gfo/Idh/MocA family oxidoreductase [Clostridiales bacterium]
MINVAIIGAGNISPSHLNAYTQFPARCRVKAIVDIYPEKAARKKEQFALDCETLDSQPDGFPASDGAFLKTLQEAYDGIPDLKYTGHTGQIENVLDAIEGKTDLAVTCADGRNAVELITAIYKSGSSGRAVRLPLKKGDAFYTERGRGKMPRFHEKKYSVENLAEKNIIN